MSEKQFSSEEVKDFFSPQVDEEELKETTEYMDRILTGKIDTFHFTEYLQNLTTHEYEKFESELRHLSRVVEDVKKLK